MGPRISKSDLESGVRKLSGEIGERNSVVRSGLERAAGFLEQELKRSGYQVRPQDYAFQGARYRNLEVELPGSAPKPEIVVIGAHYDSVIGSPGADDNATGAIALLVLAKRFAGSKPKRTLRFVAFVNEEPPFFLTEAMGSWQYAKRCRARGEKIHAMISLESIGYFSDQKGSQRYPFMLGLAYPSVGNFIGLVGNRAAKGLIERVAKSFRGATDLPLETGALPEAIPGVGWSDQWSFWQEGYPGMMVTDTAPFRNPNYHTASDTLETIDYGRYLKVVEGMEVVISDLVGE